MSLIEIPDGEGNPFYMESMEIIAVKARNVNQTYFWMRGEEEPFTIRCPIETVITLIPNRRGLNNEITSNH